MSSEENIVERRRSHGIGGAGNMHLPSVIKKAEAMPVEATGEAHSGQRRRSSAWSLTSTGSSGKPSIVDKILRRGSKTDDPGASAVTTST